MIPVVVGSNPIAHPKNQGTSDEGRGARAYLKEFYSLVPRPSLLAPDFLGPLAQLVEQLTLNQ